MPIDLKILKTRQDTTDDWTGIKKDSKDRDHRDIEDYWISKLRSSLLQRLQGATYLNRKMCLSTLRSPYLFKIKDIDYSKESKSLRTDKSYGLAQQ